MIRWTADQPTGKFRTMPYAPQRMVFGVDWKGVSEVYLERLVISPFIGTDSLEAGTVSRLRVLNRHILYSTVRRVE